MSPCIFRSATPPVTGAMSWRARASPIPPPREVLNRDFVSIKVDREERPEVDQIYMRALHALGEQGGWPLTMFLTPDAEPFWGGTYFPPEPRWGRPSFRQILGGVSAAWQSDDAAVSTNATALRQHLNRRLEAATEAPQPMLLDEAAKSILSVWDMQARQLQRRAEIPQPGGDECPLARRCADGGGAVSHRRSRHPRWPSVRAASSTMWAAASHATPPTPHGSCPTSRRCSTTTACCCRPSLMPIAEPANLCFGPGSMRR